MVADGCVPRCQTPHGCPIEDIKRAPDSEELEEKVHAFIESELLDQFPAYGRKQEKLLDDSGLMNEPTDVLIQMKTTYHSFRKWQAEQAELKKLK